jgi:hypothetical protein
MTQSSHQHVPAVLAYGASVHAFSTSGPLIVVNQFCLRTGRHCSARADGRPCPHGPPSAIPGKQNQPLDYLQHCFRLPRPPPKGHMPPKGQSKKIELNKVYEPILNGLIGPSISSLPELVSESACAMSKQNMPDIVQEAGSTQSLKPQSVKRAHNTHSPAIGFRCVRKQPVTLCLLCTVQSV